MVTETYCFFVWFSVFMHLQAERITVLEVAVSVWIEVSRLYMTVHRPDSTKPRSHDYAQPWIKHMCTDRPGSRWQPGSVSRCCKMRQALSLYNPLQEWSHVNVWKLPEGKHENAVTLECIILSTYPNNWYPLPEGTIQFKDNPKLKLLPAARD